MCCRNQPRDVGALRRSGTTTNWNNTKTQKNKNKKYWASIDLGFKCNDSMSLSPLFISFLFSSRLFYSHEFVVSALVL